MSINPGRAQILGQTDQPSNPLILLANAIAQQTEHIAAIAKNTAPEGRHIYAYEEVEPTMWVGYCLACSEAQKRFVHPCLDPQKAPTSAPPASFQFGPEQPSVDRVNGS